MPCDAMAHMNQVKFLSSELKDMRTKEDCACLVFSIHRFSDGGAVLGSTRKATRGPVEESDAGTGARGECLLTAEKQVATGFAILAMIYAYSWSAFKEHMSAIRDGVVCSSCSCRFREAYSSMYLRRVRTSVGRRCVWEEFCVILNGGIRKTFRLLARHGPYGW